WHPVWGSRADIVAAMFVYAGIDEAGYGPMFGPLVVARMVLAIPQLPAESAPPQLWSRLSKAVCRDLVGRRGRIAVNDSKKLLGAGRNRKAASASSSASGEPYDCSVLQHLERGALAFAALAGHKPATVEAWMDLLGETTHRPPGPLPWYAPEPGRPWDALPRSCTAEELGIDCSMLSATCKRIGVEAIDFGAAVVFEDRFNQMVSATRSKASASFTFVSAHLRGIWDRFGEHDPFVVVDRQSGRTHYREPLVLVFPEAEFTIEEENAQRSVYRLVAPGKKMRVVFEVESESQHMPAALASMIAKYTRELLMARFQAWFAQRAPQVKPTAGYALDAKRFRGEIEPLLAGLGIDPALLIRRA
ncbi:MAG: hypothetical protein NTW19_01010, partial [Planctomycetota bacterium]|nr:hypothetical protein [Planctomycetota bacterium]